MQVITRSGKKIAFYESIKEMPSRVLMLFQIHLMQHNSMGSTFEEIDARFERLDTFLSNNMVQEAIDERKNMRMAYWMMFEQLDTTCLPAACLINTIDGEKINIRTDEQIEALARLLMEEDLTAGEVEEIVQGVKKKVDEELKAYIPELFGDSEEISIAMNIVQQAILKIQQVRDGKDNTEKIRQINDLLLGMLRPKNFEHGESGNYQVESEKSFTKLCALLRKENIPYPEEMSVLEFYMNIELLKKAPPKRHHEYND